MFENESREALGNRDLHGNRLGRTTIDVCCSLVFQPQLLALAHYLKAMPTQYVKGSPAAILMEINW